MASLLESTICSLTIGRRTGARNTAFGYCVLGANTGGYGDTTAVGFYAGSNISGPLSTFLGYKAGVYSIMPHNVFVGSCAGFNNSNGVYNVMVGKMAGFGRNTRTVAIGNKALGGGGGGMYTRSVAIGSSANYNRNCFSVNVGAGAGFNSGVNARANVNIGRSAGDFAYQTQNVAIGAYAGRFGNHSNTTHIGFYAYAFNYTNNAFVLGRYSAGNSYVYVGWTNVSDYRDKTNVETLPDNLGLNFLRKLRPVTFKYDSRDAYMFKCGCEFGEKDGTLKKNECNYGFLAQEVEQAAKDLNVKFDGVYYDSYNDKYGLKTIELLSPIVKSIQELNKELDLIEQQIG
jgi:hypothetical protein